MKTTTDTQHAQWHIDMFPWKCGDMYMWYDEWTETAMTMMMVTATGTGTETWGRFWSCRVITTGARTER